MSRKDYIAITKIIKTKLKDGNLQPGEFNAIVTVVASIADYMQNDSRSLNRERFLTACGI